MSDENLFDVEHTDIVLIFKEEEKVQLFLIELTKVLCETDGLRFTSNVYRRLKASLHASSAIPPRTDALYLVTKKQSYQINHRSSVAFLSGSVSFKDHTLFCHRFLSLMQALTTSATFHGAQQYDYDWMRSNSFRAFCVVPCALMDILQLRLVGPFEVLHLGISSSVEPGQYVRCYRYFHDPPELVTLLTGPNNLHYGYFRDTPTEKPTVVVKTEPSNGGEINLVAPTLFAAMKSLLSKKPTASAEVLLKKLCTFAKQNNIILDATGHEKPERRARCVCPTLNGMGLVVKLREGDIGYRPLSVSDSKLSALLKAVATAQTEESQLAKLEAVDQLITYAQFACDEGDYGQSLELGLSLLAFRAKDIKPNQVTVFNSRIKHLLSVGYELAGRPEFSHVVREHMTDRRVDPIGMPWNSE
ncbi:hypothetical protein CLF_102277 [Clonorchis sinensis]|uniref:Uncharacterized protein n=1 Tax=Clonorchis sinensis TaxID=79923 RepID=G7Y7N3_CLOSI|nr:hypothetical protein CLF_102277 [Clonorchis sinensis]